MGEETGVPLDEALRATIEHWHAQDPDPVTRAELEELRAHADRGDAVAVGELRGRFAGRLACG